MFQQEQAGHALVTLDSKQREPYHFVDISKPQRLLIKPMLDQVKFSPSFSLKEIGTIVVGCYGPNGLKLFFKVTKRMVNQTIFCVIEESEAPYLIINKLANINLKVVQADESGKELIPVGEIFKLRKLLNLTNLLWII